ncbi:PREDICTED: DCC-interacting protein 13-alpha-like [Amphimedon queenslandica]|uniref:PH domain-containing protein n=1 Tax=Amphimedon queenslandica TaxID=400682 RepID=A0AAN0JEH1_AMPQE|nr:PREDICTED: DCC-interacting protein 13-alpha-like [Amphimedon queenslandica]|eukprot:XP_019855162.1 PREDICTED: DCC-interacting protein 13-alpha-like [Amphimedon queenslandica]
MLFLQLAYFKMGHEILTDEVGKFLTMLNVEIQKVRSEYEQLSKSQKSIAAYLEQQSAQICIPDPDPSDPFVEYQPANLQLQSKSGYLMYRQQGSKWERIYFYTKEHLLYWQHLNRAAEILLDLTAAGVDASSTDIDDRRYAFQIITVQQTQQGGGMRKALYFQAESAKSRDEWIATFINIVNAKRKQMQSEAVGNLLEIDTRERTDSDLVRIERERVKTFVQSHSSSTLPKYPSIPQSSPTKQLAPPPLPPRPHPQKQQKRARPPPPPPFGRGRKQSVQKLLEIADDTQAMDEAAVASGYRKSFTVRYLGSLEVDKNQGVRVVKETIRRIVAARALKNIMAAYYVNINITHRGISLTEIKSGQVNHVFKMKDISYCACHPDNNKLFGFIVREWDNGKYKFICYVFESDRSGKEVYQAIIDAIKYAVNMIMGNESISSTTEAPPLPPPTQEYYAAQDEGEYEDMTGFAIQSEYHARTSSGLFSPPPPPSPLTGEGEKWQGGRERGGMPKSQSTGSFRSSLETQLMNLPTETLTEDTEQDQQDMLMDFTTPQATPSFLQATPTESSVQEGYAIIDHTTPSNVLKNEATPIIQDETTPTIQVETTPTIQDGRPEDTPQSMPIYATVKKVATPPSTPIYETPTLPSEDTASMMTERHQIDDDFDALLDLERATESAQNATQLL